MLVGPTSAVAGLRYRSAPALWLLGFGYRPAPAHWLLACAGKVQEEEDLKCKLHKSQGTVKSFLLWNLHWRRLSLSGSMAMRIACASKSYNDIKSENTCWLVGVLV